MSRPTYPPSVTFGLPMNRRSLQPIAVLLSVDYYGPDAAKCAVFDIDGDYTLELDYHVHPDRPARPQITRIAFQAAGDKRIDLVDVRSNIPYSQLARFADRQRVAR